MQPAGAGKVEVPNHEAEVSSAPAVVVATCAGTACGLEKPRWRAMLGSDGTRTAAYEALLEKIQGAAAAAKPAVAATVPSPADGTTAAASDADAQPPAATNPDGGSDVGSPVFGSGSEEAQSSADDLEALLADLDAVGPAVDLGATPTSLEGQGLATHWGFPNLQLRHFVYNGRL